MSLLSRELALPAQSGEGTWSLMICFPSGFLVFDLPYTLNRSPDVHWKSEGTDSLQTKWLPGSFSKDSLMPLWMYTHLIGQQVLHMKEMWLLIGKAMLLTTLDKKAACSFTFFSHFRDSSQKTQTATAAFFLLLERYTWWIMCWVRGIEILSTNLLVSVYL